VGQADLLAKVISPEHKNNRLAVDLPQGLSTIPTMARISIIIGIGMMLAGVLGYTLANVQSTTALIPSFIGIFMALSGLISEKNENLRPTLMHINTILAFIAMLGSASRLPYALLEFQAKQVQALTLSYIVFLGACFIFLAIQSFIKARSQNAYQKQKA